MKHKIVWSNEVIHLEDLLVKGHFLLSLALTHFYCRTLALKETHLVMVPYHRSLIILFFRNKQYFITHWSYILWTQHVFIQSIWQCAFEDMNSGTYFNASSALSSSLLVMWFLKKKNQFLDQQLTKIKTAVFMGKSIMLYVNFLRQKTHLCSHYFIFIRACFPIRNLSSVNLWH